LLFFRAEGPKILPNAGRFERSYPAKREEEHKGVARVRTFLAVDLSKSIRDRAVALQGRLARTGTEVKWVEPENLHVTLLFLGEVDDRQIVQVCRLANHCTAKEPSFLMSVESVGCFPNIRRPRIVWIGVVEGVERLCTLHDALELSLAELGYRREERRYKPHATLGRVKSDRPTDRLSHALLAEAAWKGGETVVREILIMGSELTPHGPVYTVLGRAELGDAAPEDSSSA
jgi:2'-5' RNA ligase